ncbi:MAG: class I SAM-dependent methyltransferase [Candidatus Binatia bacterium]
MSLSADARRLFTERPDAYARFIRFVLYPQGLRAYFLASPLLHRPGLRVLEAGCGTGALTLAVVDAAERRAVPLGALDAFDLTPAMLDRLRTTLVDRGRTDITLAEANVLQLDRLPPTWRDYDLVVSASMLEYVPRERLAEALTGLRARLRPGGTVVLFVTRRNPLTRVVIGRWWESNLYTRPELEGALREGGFTRIRFPGFPLSACYLATWGHVVEAS